MDSPTEVSELLLGLLRCPLSAQKLTPASAAVLERLETLRSAGTLLDRGGKPVIEKIAAALVREDGTLAFPVRNGFPVLLPDEALPLAGMAGS